jgi:hypothetical protein
MPNQVPSGGRRVFGGGLLAAILALASGAEAAPKTHHVEPRSYGTRREPEPPPYTRRLSESDVDALKSIDWLIFGFDLRYRFEYRRNDFNRTVEALDLPMLWRTRAFVGLVEVLDPLRATVEVEDARQHNSQFPRDHRDTNAVEPIQLYGELYLRDLLGDAQPLSVRAGRMAMEQIDRRLIGRNGWRNTTNTFQGLRTVLGQSSEIWQLDLFGLRPLERLLYELDRPASGHWLFGAVGTWRGWSPGLVLEPYYLRRMQFARDGILPSDVQAAALRGYGVPEEDGFDYDVDVVYQFGVYDDLPHRALGFTVEGGYLAPHPWKPRFGLSYGHGSGDRDPDDGTNQRLDRMFGFARPFSNNIYFQWENFRTPKARLEFSPLEPLRVDLGYGAFWLDSPTDRWHAPGLRDPSGASGRFIGQELDCHVRIQPMSRVDLNLGYVAFRPGEFPRNLGREKTSHFAYVEVMARAL